MCVCVCVCVWVYVREREREREIERERESVKGKRMAMTVLESRQKIIPKIRTDNTIFLKQVWVNAFECVCLCVRSFVCLSL